MKCQTYVCVSLCIKPLDTGYGYETWNAMKVGLVKLKCRRSQTRDCSPVFPHLDTARFPHQFLKSILNSRHVDNGLNKHTSLFLHF